MHSITALKTLLAVLMLCVVLLAAFSLNDRIDKVGEPRREAEED